MRTVYSEKERDRAVNAQVIYFYKCMKKKERRDKQIG